MMRPVEIPVPSVEGDRAPSVLLEGILHDPSPARGQALVCHPHPAFGGSMEVPLVIALAEAVAAEGYRVLRFNFRGVGGSTGRATGGEAEGEDVRAALAWLTSAETPSGAHVIGYSFGAAVALLAAAGGTPVASLTLIGLPTVILGTDEARTERVAAYAARPDGPPLLCLAGSEDQFCEASFLGARLAGPRTRIELLAGVGHFFDENWQAKLCARTVAFLRSLG